MIGKRLWNEEERKKVSLKNNKQNEKSKERSSRRNRSVIVPWERYSVCKNHSFLEDAAVHAIQRALENQKPHS